MRRNIVTIAHCITRFYYILFQGQLIVVVKVMISEILETRSPRVENNNNAINEQMNVT